MFGIETYKRLLTGLTLSAALMLGASCAKIDNGERMEENVPVSFGTYGMRATGTKADPTLYVDGTNVTNIPAGGEMAVFGWYSDNGNWTSSLIPNFMYNQLVTNTATSNSDTPVFEYSPLKYWPNEYGSGASSTGTDRLSFWAFYPRSVAGPQETLGDGSRAYDNTSAALKIYASDGTTAYSNATAGLPKVRFAVNADPKRQVDLLFSRFGDDYEKNLTKQPIGSKVNLRMRHALSLIEFQVKLSDEMPAGASVEVKNLTLKHVYDKGFCADPTADEIVWTGQTNGTDIELSNGILGSAESMLILMPQTLQSTAEVTMEYDIVFASADGSADIRYAGNTATANITKKLDTDGVTVVNGILEWKAGKKYTYKIDAGLEYIRFSAQTEAAWTSQSGDIEIPKN